MSIDLATRAANAVSSESLNRVVVVVDTRLDTTVVDGTSLSCVPPPLCLTSAGDCVAEEEESR